MGGFWARDITHGSALIYVLVDDSTHSLYLLLLRRPCYNKLSLSRRETQFPPIRYKSISIAVNSHFYPILSRNVFVLRDFISIKCIYAFREDSPNVDLRSD